MLACQKNLHHSAPTPTRAKLPSGELGPSTKTGPNIPQAPLKLGWKEEEYAVVRQDRVGAGILVSVP